MELPYKYKLCGAGYIKTLCKKLGIRHRTKGGWIYTEKKL